MSDSNFEDEIELKDIALSLVRNKIIVISLSLIGLSFGIYNALNKVKVYRGEFSIVLNSSNSNISTSSERFNSILNRNPRNSQILTEVEILKSPSVLLNIFEFVKNKKELQELDFKSFSESLNINLIKGTSILNIKYDDTEKDLIIPVLEKISKAYQSYSGKGRSRSIDLTSDFYKKQIAIYKGKIQKSENRVDSFAIDKDLNIFMNENKELNYEKLRVESENKISLLKEKLKKIENLDDNQDRIFYITSTLKDIIDKSLIDKLNDLDQRIISLKLIYKPDDKAIKNSELERSLLIKLLIEQSKGFLDAQIYNESIRMQALLRPKEVIEKYNNLLNEANRDKSTLSSLENDLRKFSLEKAISQDPWELTTKPTLLPYPVSRNRRKIVLVQAFLGFLIGCSISFLKEKITGILYTKKEIKNYSKWKILSDLSTINKEYFSSSLQLLNNNLLLENKNKICIKVVGNLSRFEIDNFMKELNQVNDKTYQIEENIKDIIQYEKIIFLTSIGTTRKIDIDLINKNFQMFEKRILGQILI